jgi:Mg2+-importing ATPase
MLIMKTVVFTVLFVFKNPASKPLTATVISTAVVGALPPFTPLAGPLGFAPLPPAFFIFLIIATGTYLLTVEFTKRHLMRDYAPVEPTGHLHSDRSTTPNKSEHFST